MTGTAWRQAVGVRPMQTAIELLSGDHHPLSGKYPAGRTAGRNEHTALPIGQGHGHGCDRLGFLQLGGER